MKEDDKFDELVKEKGEKREFKYRFFFWLLFAKKAGIAAFSVTQIIASIAVVVGLVGGGTYFIVKSAKKNSHSPIEQGETIIMQSDSSAVDQIIFSDSLLVDTMAPKKIEKQEVDHSSKVKNSPTQSTLPKSSESKAPSQRRTSPKDSVAKKIVKPTQWKYLEIDPDTIATND